MTAFIVIAAVMALAAAGAIAWPLLRHGQGRLQAALAALIVAGAAAGLYPLWSSWDWHAPAAQAGAAASADVAAMVARLEQRLKDQPNDARGWLMLGRSYLALERVDDAILAYGRARALDAKSVDAALGLGEALSLKAGGEITEEAGRSFEEALQLGPTNPKALLYGGFAAAARGDRSAARSRWQALKDLHPPEEIVQMLDARIAALAADSAPPSAAGAASAANASPPGTNASPAGTSTSGQGLRGGDVAVNISLAPNLKSRLTAETPLFVFAREPGTHGPPLAVKRLTTSALGTQVHLSAADSMIPGRVLTDGQRVTVTARVSFNGQPMPSRGDLYGDLSYEVGRGTVGNLVIDRVTGDQAKD